MEYSLLSSLIKLTLSVTTLNSKNSHYTSFYVCVVQLVEAMVAAAFTTKGQCHINYIFIEIAQIIYRFTAKLVQNYYIFWSFEPDLKYGPMGRQMK